MASRIQELLVNLLGYTPVVTHRVVSKTIQALLYNLENLCHDPVAFATVPTFIQNTPITIYLIEVRDG